MIEKRKQNYKSYRHYMNNMGIFRGEINLNADKFNIVNMNIFKKNNIYNNAENYRRNWSEQPHVYLKMNPLLKTYYVTFKENMVQIITKNERW